MHAAQDGPLLGSRVSGCFGKSTVRVSLRFAPVGVGNTVQACIHHPAVPQNVGIYVSVAVQLRIKLSTWGSNTSLCVSFRGPFSCLGGYPSLNRGPRALLVLCPCTARVQKRIFKRFAFLILSSSESILL